MQTTGGKKYKIARLFGTPEKNNRHGAKTAPVYGRSGMVEVGYVVCSDEMGSTGCPD